MILSLVFLLSYSNKDIWAQSISSKYTFYSDPSLKIYVDYPLSGDWQAFNISNGVIIMSDADIQFMLIVNSPDSVNYYPSSVASMEEIANMIYSENENKMQNFVIDKEEVIPNSPFPSYHVITHYDDPKLGLVQMNENMIVDNNNLYRIISLTPESVAIQNDNILRHMLQSVAIGSTYDNEIVPLLNSLKNLQQYSQTLTTKTLQGLADINQELFCLGKNMAHLNVGDPQWKVYDPSCDQTYYE
jgi:hypothetical protein